MDALLLVGAGNMGRAITEGAICAGVIDGDRVIVLEPRVERREGFSHATSDPREGVRMLDEAAGLGGCVLLAIKPQMLEAASQELAPLLGGRARTIVSILAGTTIAGLSRALGDAHRYIRVMPNTPASIGRGMSAICASARGILARDSGAGAGSAGGEDRDGLAFARRLFGSMGEVVEIDESLMDAFTAIAGSGPAYAFLLAQGMVQGAREMGLDDATARLIVSETIAGAGLLLARGQRDAAALREAVTSPGGTTFAALSVLRDGGFENLVVRAVLAARDRGAELGNEGTTIRQPGRGTHGPESAARVDTPDGLASPRPDG